MENNLKESDIGNQYISNNNNGGRGSSNNRGGSNQSNEMLDTAGSANQNEQTATDVNSKFHEKIKQISLIIRENYNDKLEEVVNTLRNRSFT